MKTMKKYSIYYHRKGERATAFSKMHTIALGWNRDDVLKNWRKEMGNYGRGWVVDKVIWIH